MGKSHPHQHCIVAVTTRGEVLLRGDGLFRSFWLMDAHAIRHLAGRSELSVSL